MVKDDAAVRDAADRLSRIGDIAFFIQNLADTLCAGHAHGQHDKYHGQHHQAHHNIHTVGQETHQLSGGQGAGNDHFRAHPADCDDAAVNG